MPRRFAFALLALLVLLLLGLLAGRKVHESRRRARVAARPAPTRTIPPPPTPIPARLATIWFESAEDGLFRGEVREIPAAVDDVALLRRLGAEVLAGPRHPSLLRPFPAGWTLRAAFRLADGLAVLDVAPPVPPAPAPDPTPGPGKPPKTPTPTATPEPLADEPPKRWETGCSEEVGAIQSLVLTVVKNLPAVTRVVLLVGGEPVETLAGHVDLTHPIRPDLARAADEPPLVAPQPTPVPEPTASPAQTAPAPAAPPAPAAVAPPAVPPTAPPAAPPTAAPAAPSRPAALPTPPPRKSFDRT